MKTKITPLDWNTRKSQYNLLVSQDKLNNTCYQIRIVLVYTICLCTYSL